MGPGLFLALLATTARAEIPVGLDAKGVDPMAAVENSQGLDVRDELGRPVTAAAVLSDLKKAQANRASENAFATALPQAKVVLAALELAAGDAAHLFELGVARPVAAALASLPAPRPKLSAVMLALLAVLAVTTARARCRACPVPVVPSRQSRPEVLRC